MLTAVVLPTDFLGELINQLNDLLLKLFFCAVQTGLQFFFFVPCLQQTSDVLSHLGDLLLCHVLGEPLINLGSCDQWISSVLRFEFHKESLESFEVHRVNFMNELLDLNALRTEISTNLIDYAVLGL